MYLKGLPRPVRRLRHCSTTFEVHWLTLECWYELWPIDCSMDCAVGRAEECEAMQHALREANGSGAKEKEKRGETKKKRGKRVAHNDESGGWKKQKRKSRLVPCGPPACGRRAQARSVVCALSIGDPARRATRSKEEERRWEVMRETREKKVKKAKIYKGLWSERTLRRRR